jgi:hypothetical protein
VWLCLLCTLQCCLSVATAPGTTSAAVVLILQQAIADDLNFSLTSTFALVPGGKAGEYAARATYTQLLSSDNDDNTSTLLEVGWVVESTGGDGEGDVSVRSFSLCVERSSSDGSGDGGGGGGANESRRNTNVTCLEDGGLNRRVHTDVFERLESGTPEGAAMNITCVHPLH